MITYPESAPLSLHFDIARLQTDLDMLRREHWRVQRPYGQDGLMPAAEVDWRILSLRSIGGDPVRTDPGGASEDDFADTPWLAKTPYFAQTIAAIPAPVRGVRLMALGVGATVHEHRDGKYGFACGVLRLHIPIETNPGCVVIIDGKSWHWEAGRLWFGDFGRNHYVANNGDRTRIHMVLDCLISRELIELFPAEFRDQLPLSEVMFASEPVPLKAAEAARFCCRFPVPGEFPQWSEEEVAASPDIDGAIEAVDGRLRITMGGEHTFGLVHLGLGEFRLVGWTEERTIHIDPDSMVRFKVRTGRRLREWTRPAQPTSA